jgi:hypothetical protein
VSPTDPEAEEKVSKGTGFCSSSTSLDTNVLVDSRISGLKGEPYVDLFKKS